MSTLPVADGKLGTRARRNAGAAAVFGSGEMAERIRGFDWAQTPAGPIEQWEDVLLTTVNLMLASSQPMFLFWGTELLQLYNDAYRATLDDSQHPLALGNFGPVFWANIWSIIGPQADAVLRGESLMVENQFFAGRRSMGYEDTYWTYSYTPLREISGAIRGVFVVCSDTTATVHARDMARKEQERLAGLFEQAPAFFAVLRGVEHKFELTNRFYQRLVGGREVVGKTVADALPEAIAQGFVTLLDQVYTTGKPYVGRNIPFSLGQPGATQVRYLDFIYQPLRELDGVITGILVFGVDVTDGYRAQQLLITSEKLAAVGQMASTIAHEINNPLEAVTNLIFLARQEQKVLGDATTGTIRQFLEMADEELKRVSAICSQTLRFHRQLTRPTEVGCAQLFDGARMIFERRLVNRSVHVELRNQATRQVVCYEGEIRQVLNNLIGNAVDAMPAGGRLLLRSRNATNAKTGAPGVRMTIADTGSGIAAASLKQIFDPFFTTKGARGTGLGLWVSEEIIARHGGRLQVRSRINQGSVFAFFLPLQAANRG